MSLFDSVKNFFVTRPTAGVSRIRGVEKALNDHYTCGTRYTLDIDSYSNDLSSDDISEDAKKTLIKNLILLALIFKKKIILSKRKTITENDIKLLLLAVVGGLISHIPDVVTSLAYGGGRTTRKFRQRGGDFGLTLGSVAGGAALSCVFAGCQIMWKKHLRAIEVNELITAIEDILKNNSAAKRILSDPNFIIQKFYGQALDIINDYISSDLGYPKRVIIENVRYKTVVPSFVVHQVQNEPLTLRSEPVLGRGSQRSMNPIVVAQTQDPQNLKLRKYRRLTNILALKEAIKATEGREPSDEELKRLRPNLFPGSERKGGRYTKKKSRSRRYTLGE